MQLRLNLVVLRRAMYERYDYDTHSTALLAKEMGLTTKQINDILYNAKRETVSIPRIHTLYPLLKILNVKFEDVIEEVSEDTDD